MAMTAHAKWAANEVVNKGVTPSAAIAACPDPKPTPQAVHYYTLRIQEMLRKDAPSLRITRSVRAQQATPAVRAAPSKPKQYPECADAGAMAYIQRYSARILKFGLYVG